MSEIEILIEKIVRKVVREELEAFSRSGQVQPKQETKHIEKEPSYEEQPASEVDLSKEIRAYVVSRVNHPEMQDRVKGYYKNVFKMDQKEFDEFKNYFGD